MWPQRRYLPSGLRNPKYRPKPKMEDDDHYDLSTDPANKPQVNPHHDPGSKEIHLEFDTSRDPKNRHDFTKLLEMHLRSNGFVPGDALASGMTIKVNRAPGTVLVNIKSAKDEPIFPRKTAYDKAHTMGTVLCDVGTPVTLEFTVDEQHASSKRHEHYTSCNDIVRPWDKSFQDGEHVYVTKIQKDGTFDPILVTYMLDNKMLLHRDAKDNETHVSLSQHDYQRALHHTLQRLCGASPNIAHGIVLEFNEQTQGILTLHDVHSSAHDIKKKAAGEPTTFYRAPTPEVPEYKKKHRLLETDHYGHVVHRVKSLETEKKQPEEDLVSVDNSSEEDSDAETQTWAASSTKAKSVHRSVKSDEEEEDHKSEEEEEEDHKSVSEMEDYFEEL